MALLLSGPPERATIWAQVFAEAGERLIVAPEAPEDRADVTAIACWKPPADLSLYPALRAVISVGAGVDQMPAMPKGVTLCRTLAVGIEQMVRDWVVMSCLMLHRDMPRYLDQARRGEWSSGPVAPAHRRTVGVMGLGRIGRLAMDSLQALGFQTCGWSRSGDPLPGHRVYGAADLRSFLAQAQTLVCLLPLTDQTRGILNADLFAQLPMGAHLVHAGRGAQLDSAALMAALDGGRIGAAMLDVTNPEPLPQDHPLWSDPRVVVTPHVAASTDAQEGARHALAVLAALRQGAPLPGRVDPGQGY